MWGGVRTNMSEGFPSGTGFTIDNGALGPPPVQRTQHHPYPEVSRLSFHSFPLWAETMNGRKPAYADQHAPRKARHYYENK
jgi:hypothetical protein